MLYAAPMLAQLLKRLEEIRASYWFLPTVMALLAFVAALVATQIDRSLGMQWLDTISWLNATTPDGARAMLSTIAGSMMTVAGVTFSVTIAAVAYTTSQFGPRLLGNFMRDRGNQITLGTFIATFIYCLMILRTIYADGDDAFVPQIGLLLAILSGLASIAVLIYFIHHVAESIHISNVISGIGTELDGMISNLPVVDKNQPAPGLESGQDQPVAEFATSPARVLAQRNGYVQNMVDSSLIETATDHDLVVRVERSIGEFVHAGETLALVWPAHRASDSVLNSLHSAYALGGKRTVSQDPMFLVNELIEIAARALSPGVNDPFTAMSCMDWLRSTMVHMAAGGPPDICRHDSKGALRLLITPFSFTAMADNALHSLRPYFSGDPNASVHMFDALGRMAGEVEADQRKHLAQHAQWLFDATQLALPDPADKNRAQTAFKAAQEQLQANS